MEGPKRKAHKSQNQTFSAMLFDMNTPPHGLPANIQPESALRSTITSCPREPISLPPGAGLEAVDPDPSTTIHDSETEQGEPSPDQQQSDTHRRDSISAANLVSNTKGNEDDDDSDDGSIHVDMEDGRDAVYMINCGPGSWSRPLRPDEDASLEDRKKVEWEIERRLRNLTRAQKLAAEHQQILELAGAAVEGLHHSRTQQPAACLLISAASHTVDLMLRTTMRQIKRAIEKKASLTINKLASNSLTLHCAHLLCTKDKKVIPANAYYITLQDCSNRRFHYCLPCLEDLWNGEGLTVPPPSPRIFMPNARSPQRLTFTLDGPGDSRKGVPASLLESIHAPPTEPQIYITSATPSHTTISSPTTPPSPTESFRSQTSTGEWKHHPTRFQHLASFISVGENLNEREKSAVETWKAASQEQIHWIDFRIKHRSTIDELTLRRMFEEEEMVDSATGTPRCENASPAQRHALGGNLNGINGHEVEQGEEIAGGRASTDELDESQAEYDAKVRARKQCYGTNLSEALAKFAGN